MEREDQEVARLAQLVKNYFIPPVGNFDKNVTKQEPFFTDGEPSHVRGLSETPVGNSKRRQVLTGKAKQRNPNKKRLSCRHHYDLLASKFWWPDEAEQK